jgi:hypothetical protein
LRSEDLACFLLDGIANHAPQLVRVLLIGARKEASARRGRSGECVGEFERTEGSGAGGRGGVEGFEGVEKGV